MRLVILLKQSNGVVFREELTCAELPEHDLEDEQLTEWVHQQVRIHLDEATE